jgi:nitrate reductase NapAB chaperone NapD
MPVLGLVLVLDDATSSTRDGVATALAAQPDLDVGAIASHRLPVVLEAASAREAEARIDSLRCLGGVAGVDVVYADFEDLLERPLAAGAREETQWKSIDGAS